MAGKLNARAFDGQTLIMHRSFRSDVWDLWLNQVGLDLPQDVEHAQRPPQRPPQKQMA